MGQKADFIGTFNILEAGQRDYCLAAANNRGQACFNAIAPYGATTTTPPLSLTTMIQSYTLDAAAVEVVLNKTGCRGNEFLTGLYEIAGSPDLIPEVNSAGPNVYVFLNMWPEGTSLDTTIMVTDSAGDTDTHVIRSTLPPGGPYTASQAAAVVCADIDAQAFVNCSVSGATLTLTATEPGTTLSSGMALVV